MRLFIAEKPELARAIVEGLGGGQKRGSHYSCKRGDCVTWCIGHLLELWPPAQYDKKFEKWDLSALPFYFYPVKYNYKHDLKDHVKSVLKLISKASIIIHAGDPDREGQLIVDSLLEYADFKGPVKRFSTNDNTKAVIKQALANLKPNSKFEGISNAGKARQIADQLFGFNMTMALSSIYKQQGGYGHISVGRVQTPILSLIVNRTNQHKDHKASFFYTITAKYDSDLKFTYKPSDVFLLNDQGHMIDENQAKKSYETVKNNEIKIIDIVEKQVTNLAPLPFNMINLQIACAKAFNMSPDKVSKVTQTLREKHSLITYNGTDCCYLNDVHHDKAPGVFNSVFSLLSDLIEHDYDFSIKGKCFNDKKVTAHHAIIPTDNTECDFESLSRDCKKVYRLIAERYLAQFFPKAKAIEKRINCKVADMDFLAISKYYTESSFLSLLDISHSKEDIAKNIKKGDAFHLAFTLNKQKTTPPALYTYQSLLTDLTRVSKYVTNPRLKKILIEKDNGVEGENGGIGTPRTRDVMIKSIIDSDFVKLDKKNIVATDEGIKFISQLPESITQPNMTALWHEQLKMVESGVINVKQFLDYVFAFIKKEIDLLKNDGFKFSIDHPPCPKCDKSLRKLYSKSNKSHFWLCLTDECKYSCDDEKGKPILK